MFRNLICKYFSTNKIYHPLKKLDFSKSDFVKIYQNSNSLYQKSLIKKSLIESIIPLCVYTANYLMFWKFPIFINCFSYIGLSTLALFWLNIRLAPYGKIVNQIFIDKSGTKLNINYGFNEIMQSSNLTIFSGNIIIPINNIKNKKFLNEKERELNFEIEKDINKEEKDQETLEKERIKIKQALEKDILSFTLESDQKVIHDLLINLDDNDIPMYNDYLIAIGKDLSLKL